MLDVLSGLMPGKGAKKLSIESWSKIDKKAKMVKKTFDAFINPDEVSLSYNVITEKQPVATSGTEGPYLGTKPLEVTLKFFLDGTNANNVKLDVNAKITDFYETVGFDGDSHESRFLRITWNRLIWFRPNQFAFDCKLKSATVQFKLFKADGAPLRALITATFVEKIAPEEVEAERKTNSPDLTHTRIVKEGDTLPAMVEEIYGDFRYYLEIARVNHLTDFRNLQPGQKLFFPPFRKDVNQSRNA